LEFPGSRTRRKFRGVKLLRRISVWVKATLAWLFIDVLVNDDNDDTNEWQHEIFILIHPIMAILMWFSLIYVVEPRRAHLKWTYCCTLHMLHVRIVSLQQHATKAGSKPSEQVRTNANEQLASTCILITFALICS